MVGRPWVLDWRTRRSLDRSTRAGRSVPVEHAAMVIKLIDRQVAIERKDLPELRGQVIRTYTSLLFDLVLVVFAILFLHNPLRLVAIASLSYFLTLIVSTTIRLTVIRRRLRSLPANRARTRALAEQQLAAAEPQKNS
jgi:hypothetical protein